MPSSSKMRRFNDYSARKYMNGETPFVEVPIDPNVETRVKDIVYSPEQISGNRGYKGLTRILFF